MEKKMEAPKVMGYILGFYTEKWVAPKLIG